MEYPRLYVLLCVHGCFFSLCLRTSLSFFMEAHCYGAWKAAHFRNFSSQIRHFRNAEMPPDSPPACPHSHEYRSSLRHSGSLGENLVLWPLCPEFQSTLSPEVMGIKQPGGRFMNCDYRIAHHALFVSRWEVTSTQIVSFTFQKVYTASLYTRALQPIMSIEYRSEYLNQAGVRSFNVPGAQQALAELGHLSNAITVSANASVVHITGQAEIMRVVKFPKTTRKNTVKPLRTSRRCLRRLA